MIYTKLSISFKHKPPYFIGSQLRGALGYALKHIVCINQKRICHNCYAASQCVYYDFYENKNTYHAYRFDYELGKAYYDFNFYLFDKATQSLPLIISAFHFMLTEQGLGKEHALIKDFDLFVNDINCYKDKSLSLPKSYTKCVDIQDFHQNVMLHFRTPLRMKQNNTFIKSENLTLRDIVNSIYQRQMRILGREYEKFPYQISGEIVERDLYFKELTRLSNRQKTTMNLGGIMGQITLQGLNKETYEILKIGEILGVGKQCVFGLGKITLEAI